MTSILSFSNTANLEQCDQAHLLQIRESLIQSLGEISRDKSNPDFNMILNMKIEVEKQLVKHEIPSQKHGRGGNNVAENIKKALTALMKKFLTKECVAEIEERLVKTYSLKSQKENLVLFFMFFHVLLQEQKLKKGAIDNLEAALKEKVQKYIKNSENRMQIQPEKAEFHKKNIQEFKKFLSFDLDFSKRRSFSDLSEQLKGLFLRKKSEYAKVETKLRKFLKDFPCLDFKIEEQFNELVKIEESPRQETICLL